MPSDVQDWTIGRLLEWTRGFFENKQIPDPRLEAEILLAHVLGLDRVDLYTGYEQPVQEEARTAFRQLVRRRAEREPARYLTGQAEFMSLGLKVTPACLVPRPETELLVEEALRRRGVARVSPGVPARGAGPARIIELCTGCGCVAVSLAVYLPEARVTATDLSAEALEVARVNAEAHGVAERVTLLEGDLYEALDAADAEPADLLLANPPYVREADWAGLAPEIRDHEPKGALVAGPEGTEVVARIVKGAPAYLVGGASLLVEIAADQGPPVREMAEETRGLVDVAILKDYGGQDRLLAAQRGA